MIKRVVKWSLILIVLGLAAAFIGAPLLLNTEAGRKRLEKVLSAALDRPVSVGGIDVGLFFKSVEIQDLEVANPEGYPEGAMMEAKHLQFDANFRSLLDGVVTGSMSGDGLRMHIIRTKDGTNLDGLGGKRTPVPSEEEGEPARIPDLDLALALSDARVTIEDVEKKEKLVVDGVSLNVRLTNRENDPDIGMKMRVRSIDNEVLRIRDLNMDAKKAGDFLEVENLRATMAGSGALSGTAKLRLRGGNDWTADLEASNVAIDEDLMPFVAAVYPIASVANGQVVGSLNGKFGIRGSGLSWEAVKPGLSGTGAVSIAGLSLPADSVVGQLAAAAGSREETIALNDTGAEFGIKNGWLDFNRLAASGKESRYDLSGRVSLDGKLDLSADLLPLVKTFGGGDLYRDAAKYVDKLPVAIVGTTAKPKLELPDVKKLAGGAIKKGIGGILDRVKKK